jgi:restriction system protein
MLPLLRLVEDGESHRLGDLVEQIGVEFQLSDAERSERLPSGQKRLLNRVAWARTYMAKAGLLEGTARGSVRITARGKALLAENPPRIDMRLLNRYPEYRTFKPGSGAADGGESLEPEIAETGPTETPEELIDRAFRQLQTTLADDILTNIEGRSPQFFEKLVLDVLVAMGYGGTLEDAAQVLGQTGDGGVDGVIKEDRLGLERGPAHPTLRRTRAGYQYPVRF